MGTEDELAENDMSENEDHESSIARKIKKEKKRVRSEKEKKKHITPVPDDDDETESCMKPKKNPFIWSFTDEYTILDKLYEFGGKNSSYTKTFFEFVKHDLTAEVSFNRLNRKIHHLKRRFVRSSHNNFKFIDSNQEKIFELSKRIWGSSSQNQHEDSSTKLPTTTQMKLKSVPLHDKLFRKYLLEMKFDMDFLSPDHLAEIRKDWDELRMLQNKFELKNCQLFLDLYDIRCTQNRIQPKQSL